MSVLSDNPSVMLTRAELDDWHEFAKPVGAPYFNSHHEVQQAASGAAATMSSNAPPPAESCD